MKKKDYEIFRNKLNAILDILLPEPAMVDRFRGVSGFISFSQDWNPTFLPLRTQFFRKSVHKYYRPLFQSTLRPVFEKFGIPWQPPPVAWVTLLRNIYNDLLIIIIFAVMVFILIAFLYILATDKFV
jgi:hypothetical protein